MLLRCIARALEALFLEFSVLSMRALFVGSGWAFRPFLFRVAAIPSRALFLPVAASGAVHDFGFVIYLTCTEWVGCLASPHTNLFTHGGRDEAH